MFNWKLKLILIISTIFVCLMSFGTAKAAFNPMINYQGKLTDNADTAVTNGTYNMIISLCADSACTNPPLWIEARTGINKVQVTNGLFSILLGEVATTSLSTVDFNQDIYLQLEVGGTGAPAFETLLPRKRFGTVPAAFEAAKLGGLASSSYAKLATNETVSGAWHFNDILSITANSASPALNILQSGAGTGISIGNGISTTTIKGNATSTFPYGATFATVGGFVGIGTSGPSALLEVYGTSGIKISKGAYGSVLKLDLSTGGALSVYDANGASYSDFQVRNLVSRGGTITATNFGSTNTNLTFSTTQYYDTGAGDIYFVASPAISGGTHYNGRDIYLTGGSPTTTGRGGNILLDYLGKGKVAIGTSSASYKLDVMGDINTTGTFRMSGTDYGQFFISSTGTAGQLWSSDGSGAGTWSPAFLRSTSTVYTFETPIEPISNFVASGPTTTWSVTYIAPYGGTGSSLQSPPTGDNSSSTLTKTFTLSSTTTISFWWKVSSESLRDFFVYCADRDSCYANNAASSSDSNISGAVDWTQVTTTLAAGSHTLKWIYMKDGSNINGSDSGFLDNIYLGDNNDVVTQNNLFVNNQMSVGAAYFGQANYKIYVDTGASTGAGIGVNGYIKATGFITGTTTLDLAETYPFNPICAANDSCPTQADLVCADASISNGIKKCSANFGESILGVVSTNPGFLLGGSEVGDITATNTVKIALAGRVPVKVKITSGTIKIGDELTIGVEDGVAQKLVEPGEMVGVALSNFGNENEPYPQTGTVMVFINPHWSVGSLTAMDIPDELPDFSVTSTPTILDKFTLVIENSLQKLGLVIKNGVAKLKEIFVDKIFTKQLCVGDTCIGEQQLKDLLEKNQVVGLSSSVSDTQLNNNSLSDVPVVTGDSTSSFSSFSGSASSSETNVSYTEFSGGLSLPTEIIPTNTSTINTSSTDTISTSTI